MEEEIGAGGSPALRWGLTLGIVLTVLGILDQALGTIFQRQFQAQQLGQATLAPLSVALICLMPFLALVLTFGTGIFAGREDGTVGAAARAGLFGVVIYSVITTITGLVLFANTTQNLWSDLFATPELSRVTAGALILSTTCEIIVYGLIGMGVAALGGLIGRSLYPFEDADPGQPPYPAYTGWNPAFGPPPAYPMPGMAPAYAPPPSYDPNQVVPPPPYGPPAIGAPPGVAAPPDASPASPPDTGSRPAPAPPSTPPDPDAWQWQ